VKAQARNALADFVGFLNWLQGKTAPVFVIATANDVSQLPAGFLRMGRFDEMFFVDLPGPEEREAIWTINCRSTSALLRPSVFVT